MDVQVEWEWRHVVQRSEEVARRKPQEVQRQHDECHGQKEADVAQRLHGFAVEPRVFPWIDCFGASYAHLGQLDDAQASIERVLELNSELTITRLPEIFPIARYKNLDAFLDGLRKAGLPD